MTRRRSAGIAGRIIGAANVTLGLVMVGRPDLVSQLVSGPRSVSYGWVRVLGARYVAQGAILVARPQPGVLQGSVVVDGVHALSMIALAAVRSDYRRPAVISAVTAGAGAAANAFAGRSGRR